MKAGELKKLLKDVPDGTHIVYDEGDGFARDSIIFRCTGRFSLGHGPIELVIDQDGEHVPEKEKLEFYVINVR